jgi:hypothetical protein
MNNSIVTANHYLEEEGLIYLEDIKQVGIHIRGLAKLLDCNIGTVHNLIESRQENQVLEATLQTPGGLQGVNFILENTVIDVLEAAVMSTKVKPETRQNAMNLYRRFALAGLKLVVMMQIAPEKLGIAIQSTPSKFQSLTDLTSSQLHKLIAYDGARRNGFPPNAELVADIPPIFLSAPSTALLLAIEKRMLAETVAEKLDFEMASIVLSETYSTERVEYDCDDLIDDHMRDIAEMESDDRIKIPFDEFETKLKALCLGGAAIDKQKLALAAVSGERIDAAKAKDLSRKVKKSLSRNTVS